LAVLKSRLAVRGEWPALPREVRSYEGWTEEDWAKPERALDRAREGEGCSVLGGGSA